MVVVSALGGYLNNNFPNPMLKSTCTSPDQKFRIVAVPDGRGDDSCIRDLRKPERLQTTAQYSRLVALMRNNGDFLSARRFGLLEWRDRLGNFEQWEMTMLAGVPKRGKDAKTGRAKPCLDIRELPDNGSLCNQDVLLVRFRSAHGRYAMVWLSKCKASMHTQRVQLYC